MLHRELSTVSSVVKCARNVVRLGTNDRDADLTPERPRMGRVSRSLRPCAEVERLATGRSGRESRNPTGPHPEMKSTNGAVRCAIVSGVSATARRSWALEIRLVLATIVGPDGVLIIRAAH